MISDAYGLDLSSNPKQLIIFNSASVIRQLAIQSKHRISDLSTYDVKVFETMKKAEKYQAQYLSALNSLSDLNLKSDPKLPKMLYKRRYLVQTILGEKLQTVRSYNKNWKPKQLFQLYDQTYFLTVQLVSIKELDDGQFKYKFKNIRT